MSSFDSFTNTNRDNAAIRNLTEFSSYFDNRYLDPFIKGFSFVFMTRPSLFLYPIRSSDPYKQLAYSNMTRDPFFTQFLVGETMNPQDRLLVEQLSFERDFSGDSNYAKTNFIPIITNSVKNFEPQDIIIESADAFETKQGYRMALPTFKTQSEGSGSFSINADENSNLDLTKMSGIWVNYISNIVDGTFSANPEFIKARIVDYMSSLYYFVLEPDGKSIKYWSKYTGCWPSNIPFSSLNFQKGTRESTEVSLNFNYTSKEDMNVAILEDFNKVALSIEDEPPQKRINSDYLAPMSSRYLQKSFIYEKYESKYGKKSMNPVIIAKDNSATESALSTDMTNKFQLLFPINIDSLFQTIKFGNKDYVYDYSDVFVSEFKKGY